MTWGRLDDKTSTDPKWVGVADAALQRAMRCRPDAPVSEIRETARVDTQRARSLHLCAVMWTVPALTDGRITPSAIDQICAVGAFTVDEFDTAAELLTASGAWRANKRTKAEPLGSWQMILGWKRGEQPLRADEELRQARATLRGRLREGRADYPFKVAAIERSAGRCEYCDAKLGVDGGQIDHVDPTLLSNAVDNLAHVCASCNKRKGDHSLEAVAKAFTPRARKARGMGDQA